jgi:probable HAF family extracellular repeat protein
LAILLGLTPKFEAAAQQAYTITDLGTLPGQANSILYSGESLNNRGQVVVTANNLGNFYWDGDAAYLWSEPGTIQVLPGVPGADRNDAYGINNHGQIVGESGGSNLQAWYPVVWDHGTLYNLGIPPGDWGTSASAINDSGVIVGTTTTFGFALIRAVAWYDRQLTILPSLPAAAFTQATAINDQGQIVGMSGLDAFVHYHAVIWDRGSITDLGTLGGDGSQAWGINNKSQVVGQAQTTSGEWHAAVWENGTVTDLGSFGSDPWAIAVGVNSHGQIVGVSTLPDGINTRGLLWEEGLVIDVQTLIPADSGWIIQQAIGINERGQIAGQGLHNGQLHSFLLTPK